MFLHFVELSSVTYRRGFVAMLQEEG